MKKAPRPDQHPELLALHEHARSAALGSAPRKHHLVPTSYLLRWANADDFVRVTEIDTGVTRTQRAQKVARETDFYRLESDDVDPEAVPPLLFETMLGAVEGAATSVIGDLVEMPSGAQPQRELPVESLVNLALFLAMMTTRGQSFRLEMQALAAFAFRTSVEGITEDGIRTMLRERGIEPTEELVADHRAFIDGVKDGSIFAEPQKASLVAQAGGAAAEIGEYFLERKWLVVRCPRVLVTCDEPVVIVGGPGEPRVQRSGVATAALIMFPLNPGAFLAMWHPDVPDVAMRELGRRVDDSETIDLNREVIGNSTRWVFERPDKQVSLRLKVPPLPELLMGWERTPVVDKSGREGTLIRSYRPTRWAQTQPPQPWPVPLWWDYLGPRELR